METVNLLIHADPGARGGYVAAWLQDKLTSTAFDAGKINCPNYCKIHWLDNVERIKSFSGIRIRIRPTLFKLDLHTLLFLRKNVQVQDPNFTKDEYSLETFTQLWYFSKKIFAWDNELDYSVYDYVFNFESTFDQDYMISLYQQINQRIPDAEQIKILDDNNALNDITIDCNHCANLVKLILTKEKKLNLDEKNRFWSVVDVFNTVPISKRLEIINDLIKPDNYGIFLKESHGNF
jgi:hypothetical protein